MELEPREKIAIETLKKIIQKEFPDAFFIVFGSKVRGTSDVFSDIDILIVINDVIETSIEEKIFGIGYEIGLKYDVVFNLIIEQKDFLYSKKAQEMPLYKNITKEGIRVWIRK